jgi:hypothetical protein
VAVAVAVLVGEDGTVLVLSCFEQSEDQETQATQATQATQEEAE